MTGQVLWPLGNAILQPFFENENSECVKPHLTFCFSSSALLWTLLIFRALVLIPRINTLTVHFLSEPIRASNKSRPELSLCAVMVKYWTADNILSWGTGTFTPQHLYVLWYSHCGSHNKSWHCAFKRTNKYLMETNRRQHVYRAFHNVLHDYKHL